MSLWPHVTGPISSLQSSLHPLTYPTSTSPSFLLTLIPVTNNFGQTFTRFLNFLILSAFNPMCLQPHLFCQPLILDQLHGISSPPPLFSLGLFCCSFSTSLRWIPSSFTCSLYFFSNVSILGYSFSYKGCFSCIVQVLVSRIFILVQFKISYNFQCDFFFDPWFI